MKSILENEHSVFGYGMQDGGIHKALVENASVYMGSGGYWLSNATYNMDNIVLDPTEKSELLTYSDDNEDKGTAVILAAGPSLQRRREECVADCASADTVMIVDRAVKQAPAAYDYVFAADAHERIGDFMHGVDSNAEFIMSVYCDPMLHQRYKDKVRKISLTVPINPFSIVPVILSKMYGDIGNVFEGGTVTYNAIDIAVRMGYSTIILYGNDLGWSSQKEFDQHETYNYKPIPCKNGFVTIRSFLLSLNCLGAMPVVYPDVKFVNKSNGLLEAAGAINWTHE